MMLSIARPSAPTPRLPDAVALVTSKVREVRCVSSCASTVMPPAVAVTVLPPSKSTVARALPARLFEAITPLAAVPPAAMTSELAAAPTSEVISAFSLEAFVAVTATKAAVRFDPVTSATAPSACGLVPLVPASVSQVALNRSVGA